MPLGATLAVIGIAGGFGAAKAFGGKDDAAQKDASNTSGLVSQATGTKPPSIVQGASDATGQAAIAAQKQRKKAQAGDTLLTPGAPAGGGGSGTPGKLQPATLIGSK